ncbi:MAG TPA: MaoC/PaaZ C-terminal domain-containing protein [Thermoleophilaceae bacterium]
MAMRELSSPPSLTSLYPKALAGSTVQPVLGHLPGLGGRFKRGRELPDEELVLTDAGIEREHLREYDRVCGFTLRDELPATYPHLLAFPLSMELMTSTSFPFPVIGLVHIANRIEQLRPIRDDERLTVRVRTEDLADHERGTQFEIAADGEVAGETVWRSRSTYLHRSGGGDDGKKRRAESPKLPEPAAIWEIPGDIGRRYAAVSGDRNPIHLHPLTAKLFGMPRPIAHGMWLKARCLAALEGHLPDAYAVEMRFKLPVYLPSKVSFRSWSEGSAHRFALHDANGEKPHLEGETTALGDSAVAE